MEVSTLLKTIKHIRALTNLNDHCEARIVGCQLLIDLDMSQADELLEQYKTIQSERDRLGHLPCPLYMERQELDQKLWRLAKAKFGGKLYQSFYMAY